MNVPCLPIDHTEAVQRLLKAVLGNIKQWGVQVGRIPRTNLGRAFIQWAHEDAVAQLGDKRYSFAIHFQDDGSVKALLLFHGQVLPMTEGVKDVDLRIQL